MPNPDCLYATELMRAVRGEAHEFETFIDRPAGRLSRRDAIQVYQRAYAGRLTQALSDVYKTAKRILGEKLFARLAFEFIASQPSLSYSLDHYHPDFSHFLLSYFKRTKDYAPQVSALMYDLSRLEWTSHVVFRGASPEKPGAVLPIRDDVIVHFNQSLRFIETQFDVTSLRTQVTKAEEYELKALVDQTLRKPQERWVFVFLRDQQVYLQDVEPLEGQLIILLQELHSLNAAIDRLTKVSGIISPQLVSGAFAALGEMKVVD